MNGTYKKFSWSPLIVQFMNSEFRKTIEYATRYFGGFALLKEPPPYLLVLYIWTVLLLVKL